MLLCILRAIKETTSEKSSFIYIEESAKTCLLDRFHVPSPLRGDADEVKGEEKNAKMKGCKERESREGRRMGN